MAYVKNTWVDQAGQVRYTETEDDGYKIFTANYEEVTQLGTPVNADNMNHIEDGIADCYTYVDSKITEMLQLIYPVGSTYISTSNTNPLEALFGTWELVAADRVLQGSSSSHAAGTTIAAGLPNITGNWGNTDPYGQSWGGMAGLYANGAYYQSNFTGKFYKTDAGGSGLARQMNFDASRSSSIYGASNTVQPPAYVVNIWRRTA